MKLNIKKMLKSKPLLYVIFAVALLNVLKLVNESNYDMLALFALVGLLSTYFSKNMIVVLGAAILMTNIAQHLLVRIEGNTPDKQFYLKNKEGECVEVENYDEDCQDGQCFSNNKCTEKFTGKDIPTSMPAKVNSEEGEDERIGQRIDKAATLEAAYDNLQNMLGSEGLKGLTSETQKLVKQQKLLMESLNGMAPALKQAQNTLKDLDIPDIDLSQFNKMVGSINKKKK